MAAFQASHEAASDLIAADSAVTPRDVLIRNLGPNAIYVENNGGLATVADGFKIDAGAAATVIRLPNKRLSVIAETATQASPADTRYLMR